MVGVARGHQRADTLKPYSQYYIGTWNVRSMNQGKLEMVKQEMARVNVNIPGISELKLTGMGEFNSDDIISTTVGRNPLGEME